MKKLHAQICAALVTSSIALGAIPSGQAFAAESDIDGHWAQQQMQSFVRKVLLLVMELEIIFPTR